jgi:predicted alpha/beta superfamily hydrolase
LKRRALLLALGGCASQRTAPRLRIESAHGRTLRVWLPPSYGDEHDRRWPTIYFHDGQNVFDAAAAISPTWGADTALDAMAQTKGFEAIAVGIDHGGALRMQEMLPRPHGDLRVAEGDAYIDFVARVVKPWIDARYRTQPAGEHSAIVGSSLGGLMAHHALVRHPDAFGRAAIFSPAYWAAPSMFEAPVPLARGTRTYLYAGDAESQTMVPLAQRMHARLQQQGVTSTLHIEPGARHHESAWRSALPRALRWLFDLKP